jgi:hypothetical protein
LLLSPHLAASRKPNSKLQEIAISARLFLAHRRIAVSCFTANDGSPSRTGLPAPIPARRAVFYKLAETHGELWGVSRAGCAAVAPAALWPVVVSLAATKSVQLRFFARPISIGLDPEDSELVDVIPLSHKAFFYDAVDVCSDRLIS